MNTHPIAFIRRVLRTTPSNLALLGVRARPLGWSLAAALVAAPLLQLPTAAAQPDQPSASAVRSAAAGAAAILGVEPADGGAAAVTPVLAPTRPVAPPTAPAEGPPASTETGSGGDQPALPEDIGGVPQVLDSATLLINNQIVPLFGVQGLDGDEAAGLREYVAEGGASVTCKLREAPRYVCLLPNGSNLGKAALVNGAALLGPGAPDDYVAERDDAIRNRRGIWAAIGVPAFEVSPALPPDLVPNYVAWRMAFPLWPVEELGDGGYLVAGVPYAFVGGVWQRVAFDPARGGWGWRGVGGRWIGAPAAVGAHFAQRFPHGAGLHAAALHGGLRGGAGGREGGRGGGRGAMGGHPGAGGMRHAGGFAHPHAGGYGRGGFGMARGGHGMGRGGYGMGRGGFGMGRGGGMMRGGGRRR